MPLSALAAFNFSGDPDDSFWVEATYDLGEMEETAVSVTAGFGNGVYTHEGEKIQRTPRLWSASAST